MKRFAPLMAVGCILATSYLVQAAEKEVVLFDGKTLEGWEYYLVEPDVKMDDVWSVKDGLLVCKGKPMGYLATKKEFKDYKLVVEWRWAKDSNPKSRNSGVLLRITGKPAALPKCVEAQLQSGSAGDIWAFGGFKVTGGGDRFKVIEDNPTLGNFCGIGGMARNEKEPGQWNKYEITIVGDKLTLVVNGKKVNECAGCDQVSGKVGLQSEGAEIQFRTVKLVPIND